MQASICVVAARRSFLALCIFIANANELVGKSCVIKFYFQRIQKSCKKRNVHLLGKGETRSSSRGRRWCTRCRGNERRQRILRIIKLLVSLVLLPKFTFLLRWFFDWLFASAPIISVRNSVHPSNSENIQLFLSGNHTWTVGNMLATVRARRKNVELMRLWERRQGNISFVSWLFTFHRTRQEPKSFR